MKNVDYITLAGRGQIKEMFTKRINPMQAPLISIKYLL